MRAIFVPGNSRKSKVKVFNIYHLIFFQILLKTERTRSPSMGNSLWRKLRTCRTSDYRMKTWSFIMC